jgi:hypothetical protein
MSDHEAIERETVRLLVEALKREHQATYAINMIVNPTHFAECPVCRLIKRYDQ